MNTVYKNITATVFLGLLCGVALQASADSETRVTAAELGESGQMVVSYADLDLTSPEGQDALHYRISRAAEKVCGPNELRRAGGVAQAARNKDCYRNSFSDAMARVSSTAVASAN